MSQVESSYNNTTSYNQHYNHATALQVRLETTAIIENIELFLKGAKTIVEQDDKGKIKARQVKLGRSKANDFGIQAILNYVSCIINPQVVQGNFPSDGHGVSLMYDMYVEEVHVDLVCFLVNNCYNWAIQDDDLDVIVDFIMKLVIPFMTRLIDNKERESYESTIKSIESNRITEQEGGFKLFGSKGGG